MEQIYYSFIGALLAFALRDLLEIVFDLAKIRAIKKNVSKTTEQVIRNLPKPNTANKKRVQK